MKVKSQKLDRLHRLYVPRREPVVIQILQAYEWHRYTSVRNVYIEAFKPWRYNEPRSRQCKYPLSALNRYMNKIQKTTDIINAYHCTSRLPN